MSKKAQLQAILNTTLKGARFASSQAQVLALETTATPTEGTITYTGGIYFFGYEMKLAATFKTENDALVSLTASLDGDSPASTAVQLIEAFIGGDEGIETGERLRDYFPKSLPIEAGFSFKEMTLGFEEMGDVLLLKSIHFKLGTFSSWKILDTAKFDLDEVNIELENDDIKEGFSNTSLALEAKASFGKNEAGDIVKATLKAKALLNSKEAFASSLELTGQVENLLINIVGLLDLIFEEKELQQFKALCPTEFQRMTFDNYQVIFQPFGKEFRVVQDTTLGGLEVVLKPTELAIQAAEHEENTEGQEEDPQEIELREKAKRQRNILIALTPPQNESSSFFGDIGRTEDEAGPLAKLDELDLYGTGLIFSTFDDYTEVNLASLQQYKEDEGEDAIFKVRGGLQLFARIMLRGPSEDQEEDNGPEEEKILLSILDVEDPRTRFSLTGFIAKDLRTFELALGLNFGDKNVFIVNNGPEDNIKLKAIEVAFILKLLPVYVGFRFGAVMDAQIQSAVLRFMASMEFGVMPLPVPPTLVLNGAFQMEALNPPNGQSNHQPTDERPVWRNAFGVNGLGLRRLGAGLGLGVTAAVPPLVSIHSFSFNADLLLGTEKGKEVTGMVVLELDTEKPAESLVKIQLANVTLIDMIEAFDDKNAFDLQGPIREMLNVGFKHLAAEINPGAGIFYFEAEMVLGEITAACLVSFAPSGITIGGTVSPIIIKPDNTNFEIFALRGAAGPDGDQAAILLSTDLEDPKFQLTGDITILGGALDASALIDISKSGVFIDVDVNLFDGVFEAEVQVNAPAISTDGANMYAKVAIKDNTMEVVQQALKDLLEENYREDQKKIQQAQKELQTWRGKDSFLDTINDLASGILAGLDEISEEGNKIGGMLLNAMGEAFNLDYIKFEGNLDALGAAVGESGSATLQAEVQLTIAGLVINETLEIDFSKDINQLVSALEQVVLDAFDFLKEGFENMKKGFQELAKLFEKGAEFIAHHASQTIADVSNFFEDFLKEVEKIIAGIADGLDELFNGRDMPKALAGRAVPYPAKVRHYAITLDSIECLHSLAFPSFPIRNIFTGAITSHTPAVPDPTGVHIYGYVIMDPQNSMSLGNAGSKGNLVAFSSRRGPAPQIAVGGKHAVNHTKHFYIRDDRNAKIRLMPALRERGLVEFVDDKTLYGNKVINLDQLAWQEDADTLKSYSLDLITADRLQKIRIHFKVRLYGDHSATTIRSRITTGSDEEIKHLFNYGADPAKPGLVKALLEMDNSANYLHRMELLLGKIKVIGNNEILITDGLNVKANSTDISTAIAQKKWDAIKPLLQHGAKADSSHLIEGMQKNIPVDSLQMMLFHEVLPNRQSLTVAFSLNKLEYAKKLLQHNAPVSEQHLLKAIDLGDTGLIELMLKKASNKDKTRSNTTVTSILTKHVLEKAVGIPKVLRILLVKSVPQAGGTANEVPTAHIPKPIVDQGHFQLALIKAGKTLDEVSFQLLLENGARITTPDFLTSFISSSPTALPSRLSAATIKKRRRAILEGALQKGANPTKALELCIAQNWYDGADKRNGLTISLDAKANPDLAISHAVNSDDDQLLRKALSPQNVATDLIGKANWAIQLLIRNNLTRPNTNNDIALAAAALDVGADPNLELVSPGQVFHQKAVLIALGEKKNHEVIKEFLRQKTASPNRQLVDFTPSILQAIQNIDFELLKILLEGGAKLDTPFYVEYALKRLMGHPLLNKMLENGAPVSTEALAMAVDAADYDTMGALVSAGAKGTPKMLNQLMHARKQGALLTLRPAVHPIVGNFDLAAELNRTDFFKILAQGEGMQLASAEPLKWVVKHQNIEILKTALSIGAPPTEILKLAIEAAWRPGVLACLTMHAIPDQAVTFAVSKGDGALLNQLVASLGANANQALNESLEANADGLIEIALSHGADPNILLAKVANEGHEARIRVFLSHGAKPDLAMLGTIKNELADLLRHLIAQGADASKSWYLDEALQIGNQEIIDILLDNGADPSLFIAEYAATDNVLLVRKLIVAGADPQDGLLAAVKSGFRPMIGQLLKAGADPKGYLHIPAAKGQAEIVDLLILRGALPEEGLEAAIKHNQIAIVEQLITAGANPKYKIDGESILRWAAKRVGRESLVAVLLEKDADPNEINEAGNTILHEIVGGGDSYLPIVKLLVEKDAKLDIRNSDNHLILYLARGREMIKYLKDNGAEGRALVN